MKILIIDDSQTMRNIHIKTLTENNVPEEWLLEAENGDVALEVSQKDSVDLFLLDWNMPGLNGLDFVKTVREIDKYQDTPIVMITSEAAKYNVVEAIDAGVTNYIVKPIKGNTLWDKISKYINL